MLLVLNTLLLLGVTVVPFPTALVAEHRAASQRLADQKTAAIVYSGTFVVIAIFFNLLWHYASRGNRLLDLGSDPRAVRSITVRYAFGPICYLVALGLGFFNATASIMMNLALAVFFALPAPGGGAMLNDG